MGGAAGLWERTAWTTRASTPPRLAYVDRRLAFAAERGDQFELERWALAAMTALEADTDGAFRTGGVRGRYAARGGDVDAVVAVCRDIERDPTSRGTAADRARDVGETSTRLTRAFRRYAGTAPHQYVVRWRLAAAADLLASGHSVSDACYRAGFENLSHFCRTFVRTFGVRASAWRTLSAREQRRKVQDLKRPFA